MLVARSLVHDEPIAHVIAFFAVACMFLIANLNFQHSDAGNTDMVTDLVEELKSPGCEIAAVTNLFRCWKY